MKRPTQRPSILLRTLYVLIFATLLAACGGGGGSDSSNNTQSDPKLVWDQGNWDEKNWQ